MKEEPFVPTATFTLRLRWRYAQGEQGVARVCLRF